jgi:hypothetical protein
MPLYDAYRAGRDNPLPALSVQYADFALWQRQWLETGTLDEGLAYWMKKLDGIPERLELPLDRPRPAVQTFDAGLVEMVLPARLTAGFKHLSAEHQTTLYMSALAVFAALLGRYTGQTDIVIGTPIANRQDSQLEHLIGFFVNKLVMRVTLTPDMTVQDLLAQVRQSALEAYRYQDVPFERLVEALSPTRRLNETPIVQVTFALQNTPWVTPALSGIDVDAVWGDDRKVRFDL